MDNWLAFFIIGTAVVWALVALLYFIGTRRQPLSEDQTELELEKLRREVADLRTPSLLRLVVMIPIALTLIGLAVELESKSDEADRKSEIAQAREAEINNLEAAAQQLRIEANKLAERNTVLTDGLEQIQPLASDPEERQVVNDLLRDEGIPPANNLAVFVRFKGDLSRSLIDNLRAQLRSFGEIPRARRDAQLSSEAGFRLSYTDSASSDVASNIQKRVEQYLDEAGCDLPALGTPLYVSDSTSNRIDLTIYGACQVCERSPVPTDTTREILSDEAFQTATRICANTKLPTIVANDYGSWVNWDSNQPIGTNRVYCKCRRILSTGVPPTN